MPKKTFLTAADQISKIQIQLEGMNFYIYNLYVDVLICLIFVPGFDEGNMPANQFIPREGLKSPHFYEGWIVGWSR